jgi:hypothetical protein
MIPALIIFCCLVVMPIERGNFWRCLALLAVILMAIQVLTR